MTCSCGYPKSAMLCDQDELRLGVTTAVAGLTVGLAGIMRNENGEISAFDMRLQPTTDRVETVLQQNIGAGYLLHCQAYVAAGTNTDRSTFVNARIVREAGATDQPQMTLFSGYLDAGSQPSFPGDKTEAPSLGLGNIRSITGTNPAAGAEILETVPAGARWRLLSLRFTLVTDATVATRQVHVRLDDGATVFLDLKAQTSQVASLTRNYNYGHWADGPGASDNEIYGNVPDRLLLPAGFRIQTVTTNLQAGDNYGAPQLLVEEWLVP